MSASLRIKPQGVNAGAEFKIEVDLEITVIDFKAKIVENLKTTSVDGIRLVSAGKVLAAGDATLASLGVKDGGTVFVVASPAKKAETATSQSAPPPASQIPPAGYPGAAPTDGHAQVQAAVSPGIAQMEAAMMAQMQGQQGTQAQLDPFNAQMMQGPMFEQLQQQHIQQLMNDPSSAAGNPQLQAQMQRIQALQQQVYGTSQLQEGQMQQGQMQQGQMQGLAPAAPAASPAAPSKPNPDFKAKYAEQLEELQGMGFEDEKANLRALVKTLGNLDQATELLVQSNDDLMQRAPCADAAVSDAAAITPAAPDYAYEEGQVVAHVYDISGGMAHSSSQMMIGKYMELLPHTGIVVFGKEFYFSKEPATSEPGKSLPSPVKKVIKLGKTTKKLEDLDAFLETLSSEYTPASYNFLNHNSNHYADAVLKFLLEDQGLPKDLLSLMDDLQATPQGRQMANMLENMESSMRGSQGGGSFFSPEGGAFHGGTPANPAFQQMLAAGAGNNNAPRDANDLAINRTRFANELVQLASMGFTDEVLCLRSLAQANGQVDGAVNFIVASRD